jgi:Cu2+-exporting ATPase
MHAKYKVTGMTCEGCQKKISEKLNSLKGISATVDLEKNTVEINSKNEIDISALNVSL